MESGGARCASGGSRDPDIVCEKHLFKGKLPEPLFQLACSHHHCAFPVSPNELCVWNTATAQDGHEQMSLGTMGGEGQNNSKLCKTDNVRPEGSVETSLPIFLIEHCDFFVCFHNEENMSTLLAKSPLCKGLKSMKEPSSKTLGVKNTVKDKPLVFHNKIKSSGYTAAPRMTMFSPNTNLKRKEVSKWKPSCKCKNKEYPLESYPPIKHEKEISVTCKPTPIFVFNILGKEKFHKTVRFAQFYFIDTFILLCCGAEFHLLSFHLDTTKDDLKRSLDLMTWTSTKGSSFSTQQPEAYNLFLTTAVGDGIKLWDLRTLRCERRFEGHSSRCYPCGIAVSPCGRFIASGSDDKYVIAYLGHYTSDLATTKPDQQLREVEDFLMAIDVLSFT
ncbi:hypothetical protein DUI87_10219 [Hirundo rustica rustica]|uniref:WD repeat-containing protein 27 n=1 Tax=Hirundo rustica rustica TaxID=333673 RepID=A0A3M0KN79_HIRRU|nr:hypothetical protein DUI87_10219 [Hirundo rustica rustica]